LCRPDIPGNVDSGGSLAFLGKPYDPYSEWTDDQMYCSELVWKVFDRGLGVHIGHLARLRTFDLASPLVKARMTERFGQAYLWTSS